MKKASVLPCAFMLIILLSGCVQEQKNNSTEKYPVTNPMLIDTMFTIDYVADIQSAQFVEIRTRVSGYIEKIHVDEGASVKKGQILFTISSQGYREELVKANAILKSTIADAKIAEQELKNIKTLVEKNIVSKTEFEIAESKLEALNAKIEEAKSDVAKAQLDISFTEIRAPFDGVLDRIPNKTGSLVNEGDLLTTISDNTSVLAYFNVSEKEYFEILSKKNDENNNEVTLLLANNELHQHKGSIETIDGKFDKKTGSIAFRARFPNPELLLKHGSTGKVQVQTKLRNALLIPQKCTFEMQDKIFVYVLNKDHKIEMRSVTVQYRIPQLYVIESGLNKDDVLLYEGIQTVSEGDIIQPETISMTNILAQLGKRKS